MASRVGAIASAREGRHVTTSWLGSMWSLRAESQLLIGQVRAIDGELVTLSVIGLSGATPEGLEVLPSGDPEDRLARVRTSTLLGRWRRMDVEESLPA